MYTDEEKKKILSSLKNTAKEDYLRVLHGEQPESVQIVMFGWSDYSGGASYRIIGPSLFDETHLIGVPNGYVDSWGVKYECNASTNFAAIPAPGSALIDCDKLSHWRDIIKVPKIPEHIDWEQLAKKDWEKSKIDPNISAGMAVVGIMPFQELIALMGFEEAFMAFYEEPEAVKEILQEMIDIYVPIAKATVQYYNLDSVYLCDDTASAIAPFISMDTYEEFMQPVYEAMLKPFRDAGIPIQFHNCGMCNSFLDNMVGFGVKVWDPAQTMNDLSAIQKKYGKDLILCGGFDWRPPSDIDNAPREYFDNLVHEYVDRMAANGVPFFAQCSAFGAAGDETIAKINGWMAEELYFYTRGYYSR